MAAKWTLVFSLFLLPNLMISACAQPPTFSEDEVRTIHKKFRENPFDTQAFEEYKATLPKEGELYVVEGDILLGEDDIRPFVTSRQCQMRTEDQSCQPVSAITEHLTNPELIVNTVDSRLDSWGMSRNLTYAVDRKSFSSEEQYKEVLTSIKEATKDWTSFCSECGITFQHLAERDVNSPTPNAEITFVITAIHAEHGYIAAAFFPHDDASRRLLRLGPRFFWPDNNMAGVLRHEIGHIFGYRHEQIRDVPGCDLEDRNWKPLTQYDRHSVMHYICGGGGDQNPTISAIDKIGHKKLNGSGS